MLVKFHKAYRIAVAICDENLIGKRFEEGNLQLDVNPVFFKGDKKTKQEVIEIIKDASMEDASFNIVGEESCNIAKECGLINSSLVVHIQGIPIALRLA